MHIKRALSLALSVILITASIFALWQRQAINDWWVLRSYDPPSAISQLATDTTMSAEGRKIFYLTKPKLQQKSEFQKSCTSTEQTIVLGCYKTNEGIYVYDVDDARLAGVQQVTAAHEMLHAAYDRLSSSEKQKIDSLTQQAFNSLSNDRIKTNVEAYRKKDAAVVPNELHSILGSEVSQLPAELEQHYKRYFDDRKKVVAYSEAYEKEFSEREKQVASYDAQLEQLRQRYESLKSKILTEESELSSLIASLNELSYSNDIATYNSKVNQYKRLYSSYTSNIAEINKIVESYKTILDKRNAIALEEQSLLQSIDTRVSSNP